jgi:hypothetical protein
MNKVVGGALAVAAGAALALAVSAEANADALIGAMAFSSNTNAVGWGTGPTWQAAEDAAFRQCSTANPTATDCAAAGWTRGGCVAVVVNDQDWASGVAATKDEAIQQANQHLGGAPGQVISAQCLQGG